MKMKQLWLFLAFVFLAACAAPAKNVVLQPAARDIFSPEELPQSLINEQIYWQDRLIYLNGKPVMENDPVRQLWDEMNVVSAPIPKFSHNKRYILDRPALGAKILLWDLETGERKWLAKAGEDLPAGAKIGGMAFMPNDDKVIFSYYTQGGDNQIAYSDLALVDIKSGKVESLKITGFLSDFFELAVSPDGKWAATGMVTLDDRVCLLVNLETRSVECLNGEKGWYTSAMFLPDMKHIVYGHNKKIDSPSNIILSSIDGSENRVLVSGLTGGGILLVSGGEIVFVGGTYDNPAYDYVYIINQDGSDLRRLVYLGGRRITNDGPVVP
ncbi:MAG: WD40 repeat domain-containing protein [Chloroflexota bacterium]